MKRWPASLLVLEIFAGNIAVILEHRTVFAWVLLAVFTFFLHTFLLPVAMAALPDQPLVYAALVIGMLVEFPHLTALRRLLLSARRRIPCRDMSVTAADT